LTQIKCPASCAYLASSRDHPPAVAVRQQQLDVSFLNRFARDLSRQQVGLFFLACATVRGYEPDLLHTLIDDDVAEAVGALAATFETAERGVIYEHRPASLVAERLLAALKVAFTEAAKRSPGPIHRDGALVLRRVEDAIRDLREVEPQNRRAFLDFVDRVVRQDDANRSEGPPEKATSPLIVL
jgi:hypothetical protein